jgi:hypothetical protein
MIVRASAGELLAAARQVARIFRSSDADRGQLRLHAAGTGCRVTARGMFCQSTASVSAQTEESGEVTVAASSLLKLLSGTGSGDQVVIRQHASHVEVGIGVGRFRLPNARVAALLMEIDPAAARRLRLPSPRRHFGPALTDSTKPTLLEGGILLEASPGQVATRVPLLLRAMMSVPDPDSYSRCTT